MDIAVPTLLPLLMTGKAIIILGRYMTPSSFRFFDC